MKNTNRNGWLGGLRLGGSPGTVVPEGPFAVSRYVRTGEHQSGTAFLHIKTGQVFVGNGAALSIWRGVIEGRTAAGISAVLSQEANISVQKARTAVDELLGALVIHKLIKEETRGPHKPHRWVLVGKALWQLLRYDIETSLFGFSRVYRELDGREWQSAGYRGNCCELPGVVVDAVLRAGALYWKSTKCLQRSTVAVRILRNCGVSAQLVIGYRPDPFFGHAWAEVDGKVINDLPGFAQRMLILARI